MTRIFLAALLLVAALHPVAPARAAGSLVKASGPAVYFVDEGKRYVFPNEKIFFSWYPDFSSVTTISDDELAAYPVSGNVTYRPGVRLLKIQTDPKVYAVSGGGTLRWIGSEFAAKALFGDGWNRQIDDVPDAFFFNYRIGDPIFSTGDYDPAEERGIPSIADDLALRKGATTVAVDAVAVKFGAWSDADVWGGKRPGTGSRVTIPVGVKVIYDQRESVSLKSLDVRGTLEFVDQWSTKLASRAITVSGAMTVGTAEKPLPESVSAEILLTGSASTGVADDGLRVDGGTLDLHGAPVSAAWTRLAAPIKAGDAAITLESAVDWPAGSEIVVASTSGDVSESEVRVIASKDGAKLKFDEPFLKAHRADEGLRAEVALLARNVRVRGVGGGFGSHVTALNRGKLRASNVMFSDLGRKGVYGQYPIFLDGAAADASTIEDSVLRASGNRCVVLRQTHGATVSGNVIHGVYGHCLALEDGVETGNRFTGNLILGVQGGALPGDVVPAAFLVRNPDNAIEGNVVAGTSGYGYWYQLPERATRNDGRQVLPRETALKSFVGNAARFVAKTGLFVDDETGKSNYLPPTKAVFSGLTVIGAERGFWIRGSAVEVAGALLAGNRLGGSFAAFGATLRDSTVRASMQGGGTPASEQARRGFVFLDGPVTVADTSFVGFSGEGESAFAFESGEGRVPDYRNAYRGVTFVESDAWGGEAPEDAGGQLAVARDQDAGETIVADAAFLGAGCDPDEDGSVLRCPGRFGQLLVALRDVSGDRNVIFTNAANGATVTLAPGPAFDGEYAYVTVAEGGSYKASLPPVTRLLAEYEASGGEVLLRFAAGPNVSVKSFGAAVPVSELSGLAPGGWAYDSARAEAVLHLRPGDGFDAQW